MRKINEADFISFTFWCPSFQCTYQKLGGAVKLFNEREGQATIYGNKSDGTRAILDSKN